MNIKEQYEKYLHDYIFNPLYIGQAYYNAATGILSRWDGSNWVPISSNWVPIK